MDFQTKVSTRSSTPAPAASPGTSAFDLQFLRSIFGALMVVEITLALEWLWILRPKASMVELLSHLQCSDFISITYLVWVLAFVAFSSLTKPALVETCENLDRVGLGWCPWACFQQTSPPPPPSCLHAGAGLPGVGLDRGHLLPALPFLRLGDVRGHLLLAGDRHHLRHVSPEAPGQALHDPLATRACRLQRLGGRPVRHGLLHERGLRGALLLAALARLQQKSLRIVLCQPGDDQLRRERLPQHPRMERIRERRGWRPNAGAQSRLKTVGPFASTWLSGMWPRPLGALLFLAPPPPPSRLSPCCALRVLF